MTGFFIFYEKLMKIDDINISSGAKAVFYTLGCKLNFSETSTYAKILKSKGVVKAQPGEKADICIINTCTVTDVADRKCRQAIKRLIKNHPDAYVVVTGCYAQLESDTIQRIPGVDLVLTKDLREFVPSCSKGDRTRYWLKVQDGCDYFCTYCTIPFARGRSRNGSIASLVKQAEEVALEGGKEIVITGVNIGDFGKTTNEKFLDLIKALDNVEGIERYRISSLEPDLIDDELIRFVAHSKKFMPHFHIPLQSGSDTVLKLMHRHYDTKLFADKIYLIKNMMPHAFIGVDVMVGSRGETEECFEESYNFLQSLPVSQLHVFPYSERPGTKALNIPFVVDNKDKKIRSKRLLELSDEKTREFYNSFIGQELNVLFEHTVKGQYMYGFTENYIRVKVSVNSRFFNKIVPITITKDNISL